jgi:hypothetical protein
VDNEEKFAKYIFLYRSNCIGTLLIELCQLGEVMYNIIIEK